MRLHPICARLTPLGSCHARGPVRGLPGKLANWPVCAKLCQVPNWPTWSSYLPPPPRAMGNCPHPLCGSGPAHTRAPGNFLPQPPLLETVSKQFSEYRGSLVSENQTRTVTRGGGFQARGRRNAIFDPTADRKNLKMRFFFSRICDQKLDKKKCKIFFSTQEMCF